MAGTTTTAVCVSFKQQLMQAVHNFTTSTGNIFYMALIKATPTGTYGSGSTNYTNITGNTDEVTGAGYTASGFAFTSAQNITPSATSGATVSTSWSVNPSWTAATFSTQASMLFNSSQTQESVAVFDFSGTQTVSAGTFTLVLPSNIGTQAILSIT